MDHSSPTEPAGPPHASKSDMGPLTEAVNLTDRLQDAVEHAQIETKNTSKLPWLAIARSEIEFVRKLLAHLDNGGVDIWEAKDLRAKKRFIARLIDSVIERYDEY